MYPKSNGEDHLPSRSSPPPCAGDDTGLLDVSVAELQIDVEMAREAVEHGRQREAVEACVDFGCGERPLIVAAVRLSEDAPTKSRVAARFEQSENLSTGELRRRLDRSGDKGSRQGPRGRPSIGVSAPIVAVSGLRT